MARRSASPDDAIKDRALSDVEQIEEEVTPVDEQMVDEDSFAEVASGAPRRRRRRRSPRRRRSSSCTFGSPGSRLEMKGRILMSCMSTSYICAYTGSANTGQVEGKTLSSSECSSFQSGVEELAGAFSAVGVSVKYNCTGKAQSQFGVNEAGPVCVSQVVTTAYTKCGLAGKWYGDVVKMSSCIDHISETKNY